jgi:multidrug efflux pump subunit AcrA (membrane-fusion protein)
MFGRVIFSSKSSESTLVIPREAVLGSLKDAQVYVVVNNNTAKLRPIVAGKEFGTKIEVVGGLNEGELVVVNGQNNLKDDASVIIRK